MLALSELAPRPEPEALRGLVPAATAEAMPPFPAARSGGVGDPPAGERAALEDALRETDWNISRAAERLGITRNTIRYRMEKYGLQADEVTPRRGRRQATAPGVPVPAPPRRRRRRGNFPRPARCAD